MPFFKLSPRKHKIYALCYDVYLKSIVIKKRQAFVTYKLENHVYCVAKTISHLETKRIKVFLEILSTETPCVFILPLCSLFFSFSLVPFSFLHLFPPSTSTPLIESLLFEFLRFCFFIQLLLIVPSSRAPFCPFVFLYLCRSFPLYLFFFLPPPPQLYLSLSLSLIHLCGL